ncbi:S-type anion channel SLAH1-like [Tripterygium wilfordii]|uniref:S-type anion channel SLAH1-like n=1 Tax=Tripterygium wilfordii TaxID=458696 RepID=A0A7J7D398_TRIWF|nr:S-type anion channel SLAH1-like [Tripterygium wilfordii]
MADNQGEVKVVINDHQSSAPTFTTHNPIHLLIVTQSSLNSILTRFHAGYFRISISLGGQALLWKTLIGQPSTSGNNQKNTISHVLGMLHPTTALLVLWSLALSTLVLLSLLYILKCFLHFKMVKAEFLHHVGVNYLFAPWISCLLLLQSAPFGPPKTRSYILLWWAFAVPVLALDVKIYGQWFTKGKRLLSTVANPTSQLSVIGNLVGAQAAANIGWKESAICLFSLGMVHYLVLFVTLYQRLDGGDRLPVMLRPVFFLFFAVPSVASLAWESIAGAFDAVSKMLFFLSLFLFTSLAKSVQEINEKIQRCMVGLLIPADCPRSCVHTIRTGGQMCHFTCAYDSLLSSLSVLVSLSLTVFTVLNTKLLLPDHDSYCQHVESVRDRPSGH